MSTGKKIRPEDRLEPVCRTCHYRRNSNNEQYYNGESRRESSCDYSFIEDEPRGCRPEGHFCKKYKSRGVLSKNKKVLILN